MTSRRKMLGVLLAAVALSAGIGWLASSRIHSPAEIAARTAPPVASPILVPAEERILSTDIVTRGTARFGSPRQLSLATSALKKDIGVVARRPLVGAELKEGDVILTTSGRPVFLLTGTQPAYRDLGPGVGGQDVRQLEEALVRLGFDPGPSDGIYDTRTESAVSAWYTRSGFAAFTASNEQLAAIRTLKTERNATLFEAIGSQESVAKAESALDTARAAYSRIIDASERSGTKVDGAIARAAVDNRLAAAEVSSRQAVANALTVTPPTIRATAAEIAAAEADLALAQANAETTRVTGEKAVADAVATGTAADVASARLHADAANRAGAADIAAKRAALDAVRAGKAGTPATPAEIATARAEVAKAQAAVETSRIAGERDVADAQAAAFTARAEIPNALREIGAAETALDSARASLGVRRGQADLAASDLGLATLKAGVQVPADEVIFLAATPVRVAEPAAAATGQTTTGGPAVSVTDAIVAVDGSLRLEDASLVKRGMRVQIDEPALGVKATGLVARVADGPGTNGVDGFHVYFEVLVDGAPPSVVGASVRMTVPIESTGGSVLAVPVGALTLSADGSSRVQRDNTGTLEFVTVEPGLSANGYVAVKASGGALRAGDLVVIGFDQKRAATPTP